MKAARSGLGRALDQPDAKVRFYLFHGSDEAQSRGHADRLLGGLGATKAVVAAAAVRGDPALLADEAAAMSLFGGPRLIWVEPAGEEIVAGVEALLSASACESPVAALAGQLRKGGALLKLAEGHPAALAHASYPPEGAEAERMVVELGRTVGLRVAGPAASRIAQAGDNDRSVIAQELAKLALYLDAAPERPKTLDSDALDAVGAALPEGDFYQLADLALAGDARGLADGLESLGHNANMAIPVVRAVQRRIQMVAPLCARVAAGESPDAVMASLGKALFFKDKPFVGRVLDAWEPRRLAIAAARVSELERRLMLTHVPAEAALGEELLGIARAARRR